ncbi:MAG: DUF2620 family protein [Angelakisella sp.]
MVKIVVGGQMDKQMLADILKKIGGDKVTVEIKSDIEAALAVKSGQADYYFGACATGAGGALAMAIGLIGMNECVSVSIPGKIMSNAEMVDAVAKGKKAFGFTNNDAEKVIPVLLGEILK